MPAAEDALAVLRLLASRPGPVPAADLVRDLGLPRSSAYRVLGVLVRDGFAIHYPEEGRYGLGMAAFEVGSAYLRQGPLERLARPLLARLVTEARPVVPAVGQLGVLHGREVLYLLQASAPGAPTLATAVGVRLPAPLTASGRALLAALPAEQVRALLPARSAFVDRTGRGPASLPELRRLLARDARRGWALEDGEVSEGLVGLAAAARDRTGQPAAAIALTWRSAALAATAADVEALAALVGATAAELTTRLGGQPVLSATRRGPAPR